MQDFPIQQIIRWCRTEEQIRLALLVGSRAQDHTLIDTFSDYDVTLFVGQIPELLSREDQWLNLFGHVLIHIPETVSWQGKTYPSRLILYREGSKIDFVLYDLQAAHEMLAGPTLPEWIRRGYRVLTDKNQLMHELDPAFLRPPEIKPPTEPEYQALVSEFFWEITYIAKHLKRKNLWSAKFSETVARQEMLLPMLIWYAYTQVQWQPDYQYSGRSIQQWLSADLYCRFQLTFSGSDIVDNERALVQMIELFRSTAQAVGQSLNFDYPEALDRWIMTYIGRPHL